MVDSLFNPGFSNRYSNRLTTQKADHYELGTEYKAFNLLPVLTKQLWHTPKRLVWHST